MDQASLRARGFICEPAVIVPYAGPFGWDDKRENQNDFFPLKTNCPPNTYFMRSYFTHLLINHPSLSSLTSLLSPIVQLQFHQQGSRKEEIHGSLLSDGIFCINSGTGMLLSQLLYHIRPAFSVTVPSFKVRSSAAGTLWVSKVCVHISTSLISQFERSSVWW